MHKLRAPPRGTRVTTRSELEAAGLEGREGCYAGEPLPASYCNFYVANECVVVPAFGDTIADEQAARVLGSLLGTGRDGKGAGGGGGGGNDGGGSESNGTGRVVVQLRSAREILLGGGNIHCITQQQPLVSASVGGSKSQKI